MPEHNADQNAKGLPAQGSPGKTRSSSWLIGRPVADGKAEVALQHMLYIEPELHNDRLVEAEADARSLDGGFRKHGRRPPPGPDRPAGTG